MPRQLAAGDRPIAPGQIRPMLPSDRDEVMRLLAQWNLAPRAATAEAPDSEWTAIALENSFVAVDSGRVIGVCSFVARSDELVETMGLAVDPSYRGRGVGALLQSRRLEEMRRRGFRKVRTEADRPEIVEWYKRKFGYVESGTVAKKHSFGRRDIDRWTVLMLDL